MKADRQQDLGQLAQAAIAKYLQQATRYEKAVLADSDPEDLHQMRVGMRRLRTALQVFRPGIEIPRAGEAEVVGKVARKLGRLRDLDVIAETLEQQYCPHLPATEREALAAVFEQLCGDRQRRFRQVQRLFKSRRYRRLKRTLKAWIQAPDYGAIAPLPAAEAVPDLILPLVSQLWLHPGWFVGTQTGATGLKVRTRLGKAAVDSLLHQHSDVIHSLRKRLKEVRYQLKLVSPLYGQSLDGDLENLGTMQDTLGHLQDSLVMGAFLERVVPAAPDRLPTLWGLLAESRHQAWKTWQRHQQHYLQPAIRQQLRLVLAQPGVAMADPQPPAIGHSSPVAGKRSQRSSSRRPSAAKAQHPPTATPPAD